MTNSTINNRALSDKFVYLTFHDGVVPLPGPAASHRDTIRAPWPYSYTNISDRARKTLLILFLLGNQNYTSLLFN